MRKILLLALDIGTTNSKGAVFTTDGDIVASASRRHGISHPRPGWAEHDADAVWWVELVSICKELLAAENVSPEDIKALSISSLSPALLPLSREGTPLRPAMLYSLDTRATLEMEDLNKELGRMYSLEVNGRPIAPKSTGPKILWLKRHEPEIFKKTAYFVGAAAYLVYRLTGCLVADYGRYKMAGLPFSIKDFGWDERACSVCGIHPGQLAELKYATEQAGVITEEAARVTGLSPGTVVAVGTTDFLAETMSYGTRFLDVPQISYGSCIGVDNGNDHGAILFKGFVPKVDEQPVPGGSMSNGCANIDWIISLISGSGQQRITDDILEDFARSAGAGANGIMILPYFNGEKVPFTDSNAKGVIFGLHMGNKPEDLYKAALEGAAYSIRHVLEMVNDNRRDEAVCMGGGTRIPMLLQTVSDVTGVRQLTLERYNGALAGDAFIAGMACGLFTKREDINGWIRISGTVEPREEVKDVYDRGFKRYLELYRVTSHMMSGE